MPLFKFLKAQHINDLLNGKIRFGRLKYFQLLEAATGDPTIGDVEEGTSFTHINIPKSKFDMKNPVHRALHDSGIMRVIGGDVTFSISGSRYIDHIDCFVFCTSMSDSIDEGTVGQEYRSCLKISSAQLLADSIWYCGTVNGQPIPKLFSKIEHWNVHYEDSLNNFSELGTVPGDPFKKRARYSRQSEFRFVLFPTNTLNSDHITASIPNATEIFSPYITGPKELSNTEAEKSDAEAKITEIIAAWKNIRRRLDEVRPQYRSKPLDVAEGRWQIMFNGLIEKHFEKERQTEKQFDKTHRQEFIKHLFTLRSGPNRDIDDAIIYGMTMYHLISAYERAHVSRLRTPPI